MSKNKQRNRGSKDINKMEQQQQQLLQRGATDGNVQSSTAGNIMEQHELLQCGATNGNMNIPSVGNSSKEDLSAVVEKILRDSTFLDSIMDRLINKVIDKLKDSIDFNTKVIEDFKSEIVKRDERIKELQQELNQVKVESHDEVEQINQYLRRNNVEIQNVPEFQKEDIYSVVTKIGNAIGFELNKCDIDIAHRIPSTNRSLPRPIIVKFVNRWRKQEFMAAKKNVRQISSAAIGFNASDHTIYINDHLTPRSKGLLKRAKDLRIKGYKYVWPREGKIYVRKDDHSNVILVKNIDDIVNLESV